MRGGSGRVAARLRARGAELAAGELCRGGQGWVGLRRAAFPHRRLRPGGEDHGVVSRAGALGEEVGALDRVTAQRRGRHRDRRRQWVGERQAARAARATRAARAARATRRGARAPAAGSRGLADPLQLRWLLDRAAVAAAAAAAVAAAAAAAAADAAAAAAAADADANTDAAAATATAATAAVPAIAATPKADTAAADDPRRCRGRARRGRAASACPLASRCSRLGATPRGRGRASLAQGATARGERGRGRGGALVAAGGGR